MADRIDDKPIDEVEDVFSQETKIICPQCGAKVSSGESYCPQCGAKLETVKEEILEKPKSKKPRYDANHRLIREEGDEAPKEYVPSEEYKYGDGKGHSLSTISLYTLGFAFFIPIIPFIIGLIGLSTKNEKDKKFFKIAIIVNLIVTIATFAYVFWQLTH